MSGKNFNDAEKHETIQIIKDGSQVPGEIDDLQANTAKTNQDNDFGLHKIENAVLQNNRTAKYDGGELWDDTKVDYKNGNYQIFTLAGGVNMEFINFAGDPALTGEDTPVGVSKVMLELYSLGPASLTFTTCEYGTFDGTVIKTDPNFPTGLLVLDNPTDPIFIEVWRHSQTEIFMRYLGLFCKKY